MVNLLVLGLRGAKSLSFRGGVMLSDEWRVGGGQGR